MSRRRGTHHLELKLNHITEYCKTEYLKYTILLSVEEGIAGVEDRAVSWSETEAAVVTGIQTEEVDGMTGAAEVGGSKVWRLQ